jgi:DNA repair protein RecO (recombination protein O)
MTWCQSQALLLAKRPLSEYKEIWEFFSEKYGRLSLVVPLSRRYRHFDYGQVLDVAWRPGSALPTVRTLELRQCFGIFSADTGIFILYLNELIRNLLPEHEPQPSLFHHCVAAVEALIRAEKNPIPASDPVAGSAREWAAEWCLRRFELLLLSDLGFALPLEKNHYGQSIDQEATYTWQIPEGVSAQQADLELSGQVLQFLAAWRETATPPFRLSSAQWQSLKTLLRATLAYYLAGKSLQTRKLWQLLHS